MQYRNKNLLYLDHRLEKLHKIFWLFHPKLHLYHYIGGGAESVENAVAVLDVFVPLNGDTPAATLVDHSGETVASFSTSAGEVNLPMAVLVSSATQSAAELFACDLRDFGKAQLVGAQTKGDALVTQSFRLSNGDSLVIPVGVMLPFKSESFHTKGLAPDVAAKENAPAKQLSKDSQFLAAAALFLQ